MGGKKLNHSSARIDRSLKHGKDPHDIPIKHYFDVAAGIRGSDKGHISAVEYYKKIAPMLETPQGTLKVAREGLEIAEQTRKMMAELLGCDPRNVFFGNSATRTLIPIFLCLGKRAKWNLVMSRHDFTALGGIVSANEEILRESITRQNFGEAPENLHIRPFDVWTSLGELASNLNLRICTAKPRRKYRKNWVRKGQQYVLYCAHIHRETGSEGTQDMQNVADRIRNQKNVPDPLVVVDASHSIGTVKFYAPSLGDIVIMNSSKALGGEPTIGICYISDRVLEILETELPHTKWPRIAFQFSSETRLGVRSAEEAMDTSHWISLPELHSLGTAVQKLCLEDQISHLKKLRHYINSMLRFFGMLYLVEPRSIRVGPNFASFDVDYDNTPHIKPGDPLPILSKKITPYVISDEMPMSSTLGSAYYSIFPFGDFANTVRFRVSWGKEQTFEDMRSLCKKMARSFQANYSKFEKRFRAVDWFLSSGFGQVGVQKVGLTEELSVLNTIAATHPDKDVRMAALERISTSNLAYFAHSSDYDDVACRATQRLLEDGEALVHIADRGRDAASSLAREMLKLPQFSSERNFLAFLDEVPINEKTKHYLIKTIGKQDFFRLFR
jgi:selenocysteine lyase/cysteine desulfurase